MIMARSLVRRLTTLLLPLPLVWGLVACISICATESKEHVAPQWSTEITDRVADEHCPLDTLQKATIPQRAICQLDLQGPTIARPLVAHVDGLAPEKAILSIESLSVFPDPPLKRLPLLRV